MKVVCIWWFWAWIVFIWSKSIWTLCASQRSLYPWSSCPPCSYGLWLCAAALTAPWEWVSASVRLCVRVSVRLCVRASVRLCVCASVCTENTSALGLPLVLLLGRCCGKMSFLVHRQCCNCIHSHSVCGDAQSLITSSWSLVFCQYLCGDPVM